MSRQRVKRFSLPAGDKRREPRQEVTEGTVGMAGQTYRLKDWSRSGFLAMPCTADFKVGDELDVSISVSIDDRRVEFSAPAVIVRIDKAKQQVAGTYVELDGATRAFIDRHFGVDSARIKNILGAAETAEHGVAMLSTVFPNLDTAEILDLALEVSHEQIEMAQQTFNGLEAMKLVMGHAPEDLNMQEKLRYLAERGDRDAAGLLFRLSGGAGRRLSDQVKNAIDQAVRQGHDDIAEQLLLSHEMILKQDAAKPMKRRKTDRRQD